MNNIRTIGGAGGIFHIFVPGVFLLLNFVASVYLFPLTDADTRQRILDIFNSPAVGLVITIGFGYLIGVVLRIFRSESADRWSAKFLRVYDKNARRPKYEGNLYAYERFPYTEWIGELCRRLPEEAHKFYDEVWAKKKSTTFLNFCKVQIISEDERAANEIYSAESLCRYISGMFYALLVASGLLFFVLVVELLTRHRANILLVGLLLGYWVAIVGHPSEFQVYAAQGGTNSFCCGI